MMLSFGAMQSVANRYITTTMATQKLKIETSYLCSSLMDMTHNTW